MSQVANIAKVNLLTNICKSDAMDTVYVKRKEEFLNLPLFIDGNRTGGTWSSTELRQFSYINPFIRCLKTKQLEAHYKTRLSYASVTKANDKMIWVACPEMEW